MKLIIVNGDKSTGKTMSIKLAAKMLGLDISANAVADIFAVCNLRMGRENRLVGITSSGDSAAIIRKNVKFLMNNGVDIAICACSASRKGRPILEAYATIEDTEPIVIETQKLANPSKEQVKSSVREVAEMIMTNLS